MRKTNHTQPNKNFLEEIKAELQKKDGETEARHKIQEASQKLTLDDQIKILMEAPKNIVGILLEGWQAPNIPFSESDARKMAKVFKNPETRAYTMPLWLNPGWAVWCTTARTTQMKPHFIQRNILKAIAQQPENTLQETHWDFNNKELWGWVKDHPELNQCTEKKIWVGIKNNWFGEHTTLVNTSPMAIAMRSRNATAMALLAALNPASLENLSPRQRANRPGIEDLHELVFGTNPTTKPPTKPLLEWPDVGGSDNAYWPFKPLGLNKKETLKANSDIHNPWDPTFRSKEFEVQQTYIAKRKFPHKLIAVRLGEKWAVLNRKAGNTIAKAVHQYLESAGTNVMWANIPENCRTGLTAPDAVVRWATSSKHIPTDSDSYILTLLENTERASINSDTQKNVARWATYIETQITMGWLPILTEERRMLRRIIRIATELSPYYQALPSTTAEVL